MFYGLRRKKIRGWDQHVGPETVEENSDKRGGRMREDGLGGKKGEERVSED